MNILVSSPVLELYVSILKSTTERNHFLKRIIEIIYKTLVTNTYIHPSNVSKGEPLFLKE